MDENVKIDLFDAEGKLAKVVVINQQVAKGDTPKSYIRNY